MLNFYSFWLSYNTFITLFLLIISTKKVIEIFFNLKYSISSLPLNSFVSLIIGNFVSLPWRKW